MKKLILLLTAFASTCVFADDYNYTISDLVKSINEEAEATKNPAFEISKYTVNIKSSTEVDGMTTPDGTVTIGSIADRGFNECKANLASIIERFAKGFAIQNYRARQKKDPNKIVLENKFELRDVAFSKQISTKKISAEAVTTFVKVVTDCSIDVVNGIVAEGYGLNAVITKLKVE
jgi:hypothetical protein